MAIRIQGVASRVAFLLCGVVALRMSFLLGSLQPLIAENKGLRLSLSVVFLLAGVTSLIPGVLPSSRLARLSLRGSSETKPAAQPIKMLLAFATCSYLLLVALTLAGPGHIPPFLTYMLCPAWTLTITVEPSLASVLLFLAPVNAAIYGSVGAMIGVLSPCFFVLIPEKSLFSAMSILARPITPFCGHNPLTHHSIG
jgi:hypothetical protein